MLFMVVERFQGGDPGPAGERFQARGRLMPAGVTYHTSWVEFSGARCFQLMEADRLELLEEWAQHWEDLVDFEIVPVMPSAEFWAKRRSE